MSRDYISNADVPEDVAFSLRGIREALERIADTLERVHPIPSDEPVTPSKLGDYVIREGGGKL